MKRRIRVAVLGPEGTFTDIAAKKIFNDVDFRYHDTVEDVFDSVKSGTDFGVVAIENSIEGSVNVTMDCLTEYDVKIFREVILDINLCLVALSGTKNIKVILSHPHALAQCRKFLKKNFPTARLQSCDSTAAAMKELIIRFSRGKSKLRNSIREQSSRSFDNFVVESKNFGLKSSAAIGPEETAELYGLRILHRDIQDSKSQTRFIVISKKSSASGNKTSIIFAVKDTPGALYSVLKKFAIKKINLKKIESRPSKRKLGEYLFFVDFEGNLNDKKVRDVLERIRSNTTFTKILGSY